MLGDVLAQRVLERKVGPHDWARTRRLAVYGFCFSGPFTYWWYGFLERNVSVATVFAATPGAVPASAAWLPLSVGRMALDQFVCTPIMLAIFMAYNGMLDHWQSQPSSPAPASIDSAWKHAQGKMRETYWPVLRMNWRVWPMVQMLNFAIVPVQYRLLFVNVVALGWNAYLSLRLNTVDAKPSPPTTYQRIVFEGPKVAIV